MIFFLTLFSLNRSVNEVICHGIPDQRKLKEGDIVNIDVTLYYDGMQIPTFVFKVVLFTSSCCVSIGYHGDLNETYPVGKIDEDSEQLIRTTRHALDEAIKICKPGALFRDVGKVMSVPHNCGVPSQL